MFDTHMTINTLAPLLLVGALTPGMASRGHGAIVNVSTGPATTPVRGGGVYGASKAALELLTRVWADEFGPTRCSSSHAAGGGSSVRTMVASTSLNASVELGWV
jgi:NAD(P)-dependent dehydrogenase (short-subunit alcohol dehydrogenase family)